MAKKRRPTDDASELSFFEHYQFSKGHHYRNVLNLLSLKGCDSILGVLRAEIGAVLDNYELHELSSSGWIPVYRNLRLYGVKNSSRTTSVLSFAQSRSVDVLMIKSAIGFEPQKHLRMIYSQAKNLNAPAIILLKDIDFLFRHEVDFGQQENYLRTRNALAFSDELRAIQESQFPVWTVLLTPHPLPLMYEVDQYFQGATYWTGDVKLGDLMDNVTRAQILSDCVQRYVNASWTGEIPFRRDENLLLNFARSYTTHCTYRQISDFVRSIVAERKRHLPSSELQCIQLDDPRLVPTTEEFFDAAQKKGTISQYPAGENVYPFINA